MFHGPVGTDTATMDRMRVAVSATVGRHEILVALGSDFGPVWGIHMRFLRRDVTLGQSLSMKPTRATPAFE